MKRSGWKLTRPHRPQTWIIDGDVAYIELRGIRVLIDAQDVELVSHLRWGMDRRGYVYNALTEVQLHRVVMGMTKGDGKEIDHIHHVNWDNRKSQLRIVTRRQNTQNRRGNAVKACRFKGITWDNPHQKFRAQINVNKRVINLGRFVSDEDAARAYDKAARHYFGEFACTNFEVSQ